MDLEFATNGLINHMRIHRVGPERAAREISNGYGVDLSWFDKPIAIIRERMDANSLLDSPSGVRDHVAEDEVRSHNWYVGESAGDRFWPALKARMEAGSMGDAVPDIDRASTKVVAQLANPSVLGLKKRGLVVGYVQSGKTANFTAVMAKAADAGYSLFIVLSGLHNNLRRQTQVRLENDIMTEDWYPLTSDVADFSNQTKGAAVLKKGVKTIGVIKKNPHRLRALRDWLREIPLEIRRQTPILFLDDEADQATPNSATGRVMRTTINRLLREIWREIPSGTYLGYTATPFANVFMDPNDDEELYPADFIVDLPRPDTYFGAERIFGREALEEGEDPVEGLPITREVTDSEALQLRPPSSKDERPDFNPELPDSLNSAVTWFIVATAIRKARNQREKHSSMLVHTTHYVDPHFAMRNRLDALLDVFRRDWANGDEGRFLKSYLVESGAAAEVATVPMPEWEQVAAEIGSVLREIRVVVDNGMSSDRLNYDRRNEEGHVIPETVIAVGGGTLSRGLTLEGLLVSYFTRTSNTYDTLLQMGRWFGFRNGYEDLPRMWLQPSLREEFQFLATVEEEIRSDMRDMELQRKTPRELGLRVRAHPGRLAIVSRNKMQHADVVHVTYSGQRLQTFRFMERDSEVIARNIDAARALVSSCKQLVPAEKLDGAPRWLFRDIPSALIEEFLETYAFHPNHANLSPDMTVGWIQSAAPDRLWNVLVAGSNRPSKEGRSELIDMGLSDPIPTVNRAPLSNPPEGEADIKALLSTDDWFADLDRGAIPPLKEARRNPQRVRREFAGGRGLLILMPINKDSVPASSQTKAGTRREMKAMDHLMGVGVIFPALEGSRDTATEYFSVRPDWQPSADGYEDEEDLYEDTEADFVAGERSEGDMSVGQRRG